MYIQKYSGNCLKNQLQITKSMATFKKKTTINIEHSIYIDNRIYIREELKESLGMNFFSPFHPERVFKMYKSCKCSQIMCSRVH